ncbi:hypothetical protein GS445_03115 [Rhodococcus hoagii]|nr:hypothetical protein [Prescottella equi]MBM4548736.1 hypothetical protein [Prescottella equi]NKV28214.1 hypothetical protein [Prescottella equi]
MGNRTCSIDGCEARHYSKGMCKPCYRRDYYRRNKARENASNKAYREARPEYWALRWQLFAIQNRDEINAKSRARYAADPDRHRAMAADYRRRNPGKSDEWRKRNPELWALRNRENQRRRRRAEGVVDYAQIVAECGMVCHICSGEIASLNDLHMDHVIPLSKGGPHRADNIRPAHALCNLQKGAKMIA